jgi:hypothetical protein
MALNIYSQCVPLFFEAVKEPPEHLYTGIQRLFLLLKLFNTMLKYALRLVLVGGNLNLLKDCRQN